MNFLSVLICFTSLETNRDALAFIAITASWDGHNLDRFLDPYSFFHYPLGMSGLERPVKISLFLIFFFGILVRLYIAYHFYGTFDVNSWEKIFDYWRQGISPYDLEHRYAYSPLWFWVISLFSILNSFTHFPAYFVVKLPLILGDIGIGWLLWKISGNLGENSLNRSRIVALFFLNPVSFLNTCVMGQFDNLSCLFLLASYFCTFTELKLKDILSLLLFSLAVAMKQTALLFLPIFMFRQRTLSKQISLLLLAPAFFFLFLFPYLRTDPSTVYKSVILDSVYVRLEPFRWGWTLILNNALMTLFNIDLMKTWVYDWAARANCVLYIFLGLVAYRFSKKTSFTEATLLYLLIFYVSTTIFALQYIVWIIPFAALKKDKMFILFSMVMGCAYLAFFEWHVQYYLGNIEAQARITPVFAWLNVLSWLVLLTWLLIRLRAWRRTAAF